MIMLHRFLMGVTVWTLSSLNCGVLAQANLLNSPNNSGNTNNVNLPTIEFSRPSYLVTENAGDSKVVTLVRTGDLSKPSTVTLVITPESTAKDGEDYDSNKIELTVTFKAGEARQTITVPIKNDGDLEEKETIIFAINNVNNAKLGSQANTTLEITDIDTSKLPNAIRFEIVNGIIEYVNNAQQATIALQWSLLPFEGNTQLIKALRENYPDSKPVTCSIRNEDLGTSQLIDRLSKDCQDYLVDAFRVANINALKQALSEQFVLKSSVDREKGTSPVRSAVRKGGEFENFWATDGGEGYDFVFNKRGGISTAQYFGALRDYLNIKLLLSSNGISYSFDVSGSPQPQGEFPRISNQGIKWEIKIYRFKVAKVPEIYLYRFTAKALIEPFNLVFPASRSSSDPKNPPKATTIITFKTSEGTIGILEPNLTATPFDLVLSPATEEKIEALKASNSDQELITILSYFFNPDLGKIVSNNFLGQLQNVSIITGGLISDNYVDSLIGVNSQLTTIGDAKVGALLGVGLTNNSPLFVGPSLSYSIFTASVGARVSSQNESIRVDPAGLISFDLSQVVGGRQQIKEVKIDQNQVGGNWGEASDKISKNLALVYWTKTVSEDDKNSIILVNTTDCDDQSIPLENQAKIPWKTVIDSKVIFIPTGKYEYQRPLGNKVPERPRPLDVCNAQGVNGIE
jgi:hypothetical protein